MPDAGIPCPGSSAYRSCNHVRCLCCWWYTYSPGKPQGRRLIGDEQWLLLSDKLSMVPCWIKRFTIFPIFLKKKFTTTPFWMTKPWHFVSDMEIFLPFIHNIFKPQYAREGFVKPTATFPQTMHYTDHMPGSITNHVIIDNKIFHNIQYVSSDYQLQGFDTSCKWFII